MSDFGNILKLMVEEEGEVSSQTSPSSTIESATSPAVVFTAFQREQNTLWANLKNVIAQQLAKVDALHGHVGDLIHKTVGTQKDLQTQLSGLKAPERRDTSKLDTLRGQWQQKNAPKPTGGQV